MNLMKLNKSKKSRQRNLIYRKNEYSYSFEKFQTINTFGRDFYNSTITLNEADKDQSDLLIEDFNFKKQIKLHDPEKKQKEKDIIKNLHALFDGRERDLDAF